MSYFDLSSCSNRRTENASERIGTFAVCTIKFTLGCLVSYILIALPIGRKAVRPGLAVMSLPMEIALLQVAYFVGCLLGVLMSVLFLEKLNRKHTTLVLLFLCACSTAAFGTWNDILAIIGFRSIIGFFVGSLVDTVYKQFPIPGDLYHIASFVLFLLGLSVGPFIGLSAASPSFEVKMNGISLRNYPFLLPSVIIGFAFIFCILIAAMCLRSDFRSSRKGDNNMSYRPLDSEDEAELLNSRDSSDMDVTVHGSGFEMAENNNPPMSPSYVGLLEDGDRGRSATFDVSGNNSSSGSLLGGESSNSLDESTSPMGSPISQLRNGPKKHRNRVLFSTKVTVKVIGSPELEYDHLKHQCHDEKPIDSSNLSMTNDGSSSSFPIYGNGSELFLEELSDLSASRGIAKLLSKETVVVCLVMNGLSGLAVVYAVELIYLDMFSSQIFEDKMSMFALFQCTNGLAALISVTVLSLFFTKKMGTLFVFYRSSQVFSFAVMIIFVMPFVFDFMNETTYYGIIWAFSATICSCAAIMTLLVFSFTNNSCYNHEKIIVNRAATLSLLLGLMSGSYISVSLFTFSEWLRDEFELRFQVAWFMLIILARLLTMLLRRLPNKIQRSMREPAKPRYAVTMAQDVDAGFHGNDEDQSLENMESSISASTPVDTATKPLDPRVQSNAGRIKNNSKSIQL